MSPRDALGPQDRSSRELGANKLNELSTYENEAAGCELCRKHLTHIRVDCPPGLILPPNVSPPEPLKVLFVGVAPPEKGRHFYTASHDNLRSGLFRTLTELGWPCRRVVEFLDHGFLLLHTAKCAIEGTTSPSLLVSQLCASHHLKREIELLHPEAVCWLSKKIGYPVCKSLC
jgi:uracil-DNA glycosylase